MGEINLTWKEQTILVLGKLEEDTFTVEDLRTFFPQRNDNGVTATLCQLIADECVFRTGKRVRSGKTRSRGFVEYTTNKALAANGGDATPLRGYDAADISKIQQGDQPTNGDKQITHLKRQVTNLKTENKKLKGVLSSLPQHQLIDLLLD